MTPLAFVDVETTGLDRDVHSIWDVALILRTFDDEGPLDKEYQWFLPVELDQADPQALEIGRFTERYEPPGGLVSDDFHIHHFADTFSKLTKGAHLVGMNISFDEVRLYKLLHHQGKPSLWHYHLVDLEPLMLGFLLGAASRGDVDAGLAIPDIPWKSDDLSTAIGIDRSTFEKHSALGDAQWAKACFDAVVGDRYADMSKLVNG